MEQYTEKKFSIPELKGISKETIENHLKLYAGYVKHTNLIHDQIKELRKDSEKKSFTLGELQRRLSFEWNGMRNHEYYFASLEGGPKELSDSDLKKQIEKQFGSFDEWLTMFKSIASTRGIGWAMLYWDDHADQLVHAWVDEQHLGQLNGLSLILGLDMWEHSYMMDYASGDKKKYVDAFFENLNWEVVEKNFSDAVGQ